MPSQVPNVEASPLIVNLRAAPQIREYQEIVARIARDRPRLTLDWGCGWGQITSMLEAAGLRVEAFEYGGPGAPDARVPLEHFPPLQAYLASDPVALPYDDGRFDAILSCGVLEHVIDPDGSLDELRRVAVPGGLVYCFKLPNRHSYVEWMARVSGRLYYHGKGEFDRLYTARAARALFERHGFEVLELRRANMLPLLITADWARAGEDAIWAVNRALSRVPALNVLATNVELVARARR